MQKNRQQQIQLPSKETQNPTASPSILAAAQLQVADGTTTLLWVIMGFVAITQRLWLHQQCTTRDSRSRCTARFFGFGPPSIHHRWSNSKQKHCPVTGTSCASQHLQHCCHGMGQTHTSHHAPWLPQSPGGAQPALAVPGQVHTACTEEEELSYSKEIGYQEKAGKQTQTNRL